MAADRAHSSADERLITRRENLGCERSGTMVIDVHGLADETLRLQEYSPGFDPERFAAHETFLVRDVRRWVRTRFGVALPALAALPPASAEFC